MLFHFLRSDNLVDNYEQYNNSLTILKSQKPLGFSYHMIYKALFKNNEEVKLWLCKKKADIQEAFRVGNAYMGLSTQDVMTVFSKRLYNENGDIICKWWVDESVYTKNRLFRTFLSEKIGKPFPFLFMQPHMNMTVITVDLFTSTLVVPIGHKKVTDMAVPSNVEDNIAKEVQLFLGNAAEWVNSETSTTTVFRSNPAVVTNYKPATSTLTTDMTSTVSGKGTCDMRVLTVSNKRCMHLAKLEISKLYDITFSHLSVVSISPHRRYVTLSHGHVAYRIPCPVAGRVHSNNHMYWNVGLSDGVIWLKCHACTACNNIITK